MTDFPQPTDPLFRLAKDTPLTQGEAAFYIKKAWKELFNEEINVLSLSILWSQCAVETAGFTSIKNWNFGNIRQRINKPYTSYKCHEYLNGQRIDIIPFDPRSFFEAWDDVSTGLRDYISFLEQPRYAAAFQAVKNGNATQYVVELKQGGYFTADVNEYAKAVLTWQNIFLTHKDVYWNYTPISETSSTSANILSYISDAVQNILGLK